MSEATEAPEKKKSTRIYSLIEARAEKLGWNISDLCREAEVDRSVLSRLKDRVPKSIKTLYQIEETLKAAEAKANS